MRLDVRPDFAPAYLPNETDRDAVFASQRDSSSGSAPRYVFGANGADYLLGELCHAVARASSVTPPRVPVASVVGAGSGLEVIRVNTRPVIALVANDNALDVLEWDAFRFAVGDPMGFDEFASAMNDPVAIAALETLPVDAVGHVQPPSVKRSVRKMHGNWHGYQLSGATLAMQERF